MTSNSAGLITGAPSELGSFNMTLSVTDDSGFTETRVVTLNVIDALTDASQVTAGDSHSCALDGTGAAWCWGNNEHGQLGNDTGEAGTPIPVRVSEDLTFTAISAGTRHTCALDQDGGAWCWGVNQDGELGNDSEGTDSSIPVEVAGDHVFTSISAGSQHTCAIDDDRRAWCWGSNSFGRLGREGASSPVPVEVSGDHEFSSISASSSHSCALDGDGAAWCWGGNDHGQLGHGDEEAEASDVPVAVEGDHVFDELVAGSGHSCAVADAAAWCWGDNEAGQLGSGDDDADSSLRPVGVAGEQSFAPLAAGGQHTCALEGEAAWCWGADNANQLGAGPGDNELGVPVEVVGERAFARIAAGDDHTCAIDDGVVYCWGANGRGQLGHDGDLFAGEPTPVHPHR